MELTSLNRVLEAARSGDVRTSLVAIRDNLALRLENCPARDAAAIAKQLSDVIQQIDELPKPEGASLVDQLARKRADRRTGT